MPFWIEMMKAGTFYLIYESAALAVEQGKSTPAEKKFIESLDELVAEYKYHADLKTLFEELKTLADMRRELNKRRIHFQKKMVLLKSKGERVCS